MENKLTLEHLAPYLPYGVELAFIVRNEVRYIDKITGISDIGYYDDIKIKLGYHDSEHIWMFKPILRPMSDLSKNSNFWRVVSIMDDNFGEYISVDSDCDIEVECDGCCVRYVSLHNCYKAYTELFKNHFDVFGLIEKGLAVDVNTIENA